MIRVNASHGSPELRAAWIAAVRRAADAAGSNVAVLVDLQGPRIRVGAFSRFRHYTNLSRMEERLQPRVDVSEGLHSKVGWWTAAPSPPTRG